MRKVIGIGETVLDIIFKNDQPIGAVPGGSVFNGVISLGRSGVQASFIVRQAMTEWVIALSPFHVRMG